MLCVVSRVGEPASQRTGCYLCGRPTFDPDKRSRPWARAAIGGRQVLVCPFCQQDRPDWDAGLDRCERCDSIRLSAMLGEVVCRACGTVQGSQEAAAGHGEPDFTGV
jgi:hypothetical protein